MKLRRLGPDDAVAFQALRLQSLREDPIAFVSSYDEERDTPLTRVAEQLAPSEDRAIVGAFDGPALVGLAGWRRERLAKLHHKGLVWGVYVRPSHRGRGVARQLVGAVITLARRARGIVVLNLVAHADNLAAIALYESLGFVIYGREGAALCVDGLLHDDVHMGLRL